MTSLMMRRFTRDKEPKLTGLKKATKTLGSSMRKLLSDASRTRLWEFGIAKANGVMERIV